MLSCRFEKRYRSFLNHVSCISFHLYPFDSHLIMIELYYCPDSLVSYHRTLEESSARNAQIVSIANGFFDGILAASKTLIFVSNRSVASQPPLPFAHVQIHDFELSLKR